MSINWGGTNSYQLFQAILAGDLNKVKLAIKQGATVNKDGEGWIPLDCAMFYGQFEAAELLIENGAEVNTKDSDGNSLLHLALDYDRIEMVRLLIEHGADVNIQNSEGNRPLTVALEKGYADMIALLRQHNAMP